jgi:hypothetical protein
LASERYWVSRDLPDIGHVNGANAMSIPSGSKRISEGSKNRIIMQGFLVEK